MRAVALQIATAAKGVAKTLVHPFASHVNQDQPASGRKHPQRVRQALGDLTNKVCLSHEVSLE